jgi:hypothetical protein
MHGYNTTILTKKNQLVKGEQGIRNSKRQLYCAGPMSIQNSVLLYYRPFALTSQILRLSSRCSLTISVRVQKPHTAQELAILIQNYYKLLKNLLCLQKLYYA